MKRQEKLDIFLSEIVTELFDFSIKENDFKTHIETLIDTIETHKETIKNNAQYLNFTESIGVVVDKHKSTTPNENDYITVVFKTLTDEFVINKYVVNYHPN